MFFHDVIGKPRLLMSRFRLYGRIDNHKQAYFNLNNVILDNGFPRWEPSRLIPEDFVSVVIQFSNMPNAFRHIELLLSRPSICLTQGHFPQDFEPSAFLIHLSIEKRNYELILLIKGSEVVNLLYPFFHHMETIRRQLNVKSASQHPTHYKPALFEFDWGFTRSQCANLWIVRNWEKKDFYQVVRNRNRFRITPSIYIDYDFNAPCYMMAVINLPQSTKFLVDIIGNPELRLHDITDTPPQYAQYTPNEWNSPLQIGHSPLRYRYVVQCFTKASFDYLTDLLKYDLIEYGPFPQYPRGPAPFVCTWYQKQ
jgi:hypothetical protein